MNQQRSRRFRASKEAAEKALQIEKVRAKLEADGFPLPSKKDSELHFDSNCITPGTPFMSRYPGFKASSVILASCAFLHSFQGMDI